MLGITEEVFLAGAFPKALSVAANKASWEMFPAPTTVKFSAT